jgi:pimeloyl-ACP methyl ester carboxylesterase
MTSMIEQLPAGVSAERIPVGDDEVHLLRGGEGRPLLYLHASGGGGLWLPFHQLLARDHAVHAPEHPGFAGSGDFSALEDAHDLAFHYLDLMDALGLEKPIVVGSSFGGWIAAELAAYAPERVDRLVLIDPIGLYVEGHPIGDLFAMTPEQKVGALFANPAVAAGFFPAQPDVDFLLAVYRDETAFARYAWEPFCHDPKLPRLLRRVAAPALVLWGEHDRLVPRAHGERYAELIPGARLEVLPGAGHAAHMEHPRETAAAVHAFLADD